MFNHNIISSILKKCNLDLYDVITLLSANRYLSNLLKNNIYIHFLNDKSKKILFKSACLNDKYDNIQCLCENYLDTVKEVCRERTGYLIYLNEIGKSEVVNLVLKYIKIDIEIKSSTNELINYLVYFKKQVFKSWCIHFANLLVDNIDQSNLRIFNNLPEHIWTQDYYCKIANFILKNFEELELSFKSIYGFTNQCQYYPNNFLEIFLKNKIFVEHSTCSGCTKGEYRWYVIRKICTENNVELFKLYMKSYIDTGDYQIPEQNLFIHSCKNNSPDIVREFLKRGTIDPNIHKNEGPRCAIRCQYYDVVKVLLEYDIVDMSFSENFAIRYACNEGNVALLKLLLDSGKLNPQAQKKSIYKKMEHLCYREILKVLDNFFYG